MYSVETAQVRACFYVTTSCTRTSHALERHLQCFSCDSLELWVWRLSNVNTNVTKQDHCLVFFPAWFTYIFRLTSYKSYDTTGNRDLCLWGSPSPCWGRPFTLIQTGRISKTPALGEVPGWEFSGSQVRSGARCCFETRLLFGLKESLCELYPECWALPAVFSLLMSEQARVLSTRYTLN